MKTLFSACGLFAALIAAAVCAEDWPQFRGPGRDGLSAEKGLQKIWPAAGPQLLWQVKDAGFGYGALAVAGGRGYLVGNEGLENEFVLALDLTNGRHVWKTTLGKVGNPNQQPSYPGARSTPTVVGNRVYALGSDGDLACLETTGGRMVWKKNLRAEFGGKPGVWAYSESPLVEEGRVFVAPGGEQAGLAALDAATGATVWTAPGLPGETAGYASAVTTTAAGGKTVVQFLGKGVVGVSAAEGKVLWRYSGTVDTRFGVHAATPIAAGDAVYTSSATGGGLARIRTAGGASSAEPVFLERKAPNALGGAVKIGDHLYGATFTTLVCIEFATGKLVWEDRCVGAASICAADGLLFVHGENGQVALVEATPAGYREKGRFTPPGGPERGNSKAWAYPVVANGRLFLRDLGTVWCYDIRAPR